MPDACRIVRAVKDIDSALNAVCPDECKTTLPLKTRCREGCLEARDYCRVAQKEIVSGDVTLIGIKTLVDSGELPAECSDAEGCAQSLDAYESCVYVQPSNKTLDSCYNCIFAQKEYTYDPPVYTDCSACDGTSKEPPKITTAQFAEATKDGMYGRDDSKAISALILPAYILPLLNVAVTLMFIRTFAPILGGDMEIPGVSKLL